jgi:hypothetical protein
MNGWMGGWFGGQIDGSVSEYVYGWMNVRSLASEKSDRF